MGEGVPLLLLAVDKIEVQRLGATVEYLAEGLPELRVEDSVDDRVEEGVDVAQPSCQDESCHPWRVGQIKLSAQGIEDGTGEEWRPTE